MANTHYDSALTANEIEAALEAINGVISPSNNGKVLAISNGKIVARSVQWGGGSMQSKTVIPTATEQTVTPDSDYVGLSSVVVEGDVDLIAGNIRKDVTIFGVTGSYAGGSGGVYAGETPPDALIGNDGDVYIQTLTAGACVSDGACYVDTGIFPNARFEAEIEAALAEIHTDTWDTFFGTRGSNSLARFLIRFAAESASASQRNLLAVQKSESPSSNMIDYNTSISRQNMLNTYYKFQLNDVWRENQIAKQLFSTTNTAAFPYSFYLFALNNEGTAAQMAYAKIKWFKVKDNNDNLVGYFVGTKKNDVPCMLNMVDGTYHYNLGTGSLTFDDAASFTPQIVWIKKNGSWEIYGYN